MKNISLGVVPVMFAGAALGPVIGLEVGALADIITFLLFPKGGAYFPGFTITYGLIGLIPGLLLYKRKTSFLRTLLGVAVTHLVCSFGLNTFFLIQYFALSPEIIIPRSAVQTVMIPVYSALVFTMMKYKSQIGIPDAGKNKPDNGG